MYCIEIIKSVYDFCTISLNYISGDLEQQCENAVFEICDARERYPLLCANEFGKTIKLINEINV